MLRRAGPVAMLLALAACTQTPEPVDCATADWQAVGFADGSAGAGSGPTASYAQCPGFDEGVWQAGYLAGLVNHCSEARIYRNARTGLSFPQACRPLEADLSAAHVHGRSYWEADQAMWRLRRRARDDVILGQRFARSAEYNALRRERARYASWPP